jgi:two-component system, probable response regulator PhcQ
MGAPHTRKVLVVDDEVSFLNSMQRYLRNEPYQVLTAENGKIALELLQENEVFFVLTDYRMPGMDGLTLLREIRLAHPHIITAMLTAVQDIQLAMEAVNNLGVHKFFLKPINGEEILTALRTAAAFIENNGQRPDDGQQKLKRQETTLRALERDYPGITKIDLVDGMYDPTDT